MKSACSRHFLWEFFPESQRLLSMTTELKAADIHGAFGSSHCGLAMPPLLLTFILVSILLSPIHGRLGIANLALALVSIAIVGITVDFGSLSFRERRAELGAETSHSGQVSALEVQR